MEISFEIVAGKKGEPAMGGERLRFPKEQRREQRADQNGREQINQQSDGVLQGC